MPLSLAVLVDACANFSMPWVLHTSEERRSEAHLERTGRLRRCSSASVNTATFSSFKVQYLFLYSRESCGIWRCLVESLPLVRTPGLSTTSLRKSHLKTIGKRVSTSFGNTLGRLLIYAHMALRQPNNGLRPAFSASWRIERSSFASHVAETLDLVNVTCASSMSVPIA